MSEAKINGDAAVIDKLANGFADEAPIGSPMATDNNILEWLKLVAVGPVIELRALGGDRPKTTLYKTDAKGLKRLAGDAERHNRAGLNCYVTMNEVRGDKTNGSVSEADITRRRWLLIDADPARAADASATDAEKLAARGVADSIRVHLDALGWPLAVFADSGNGYHLRYKIDLPADDQGLVKRVLKSLRKQFGTKAAAVDTTVCDPPRICKLYGVVSRKGPNTPERPHRRSVVIESDPAAEIVTEAQLEAVAKAGEPKPNGKPKKSGLHLADIPAPGGDRVKQYVAKAMGDEFAKVAAQPSPGRRTALFSAVCQLARFVRGDLLTKGEVEAGARSAAAGWVDLPESEIDHNIESGFNRNPSEVATRADVEAILDAKDAAEGKAGGTRAKAAAEAPDDIPWAASAAPDDPFTIAALHRRKHRFGDESTIVHHRGEFLVWRDSAYRARDDKEIKGGLARTAHDYLQIVNDASLKGPKKKISVASVNAAALALQSLSILDGDREEPCWIDGAEPFPADEILPARNAMIHIPTLFVDGPEKATVPATPNLFTRFALPYDIDLIAPDEPVEWLRFLESVFPGDPWSQATLQEIFGLALVSDTSHQKIFGFIGVKRSGKGTVARVLAALLGKENVSGQTLASMGKEFGLMPLIGKRLCIVSDARLSSKSDLATTAERLLSISGEDTLSINRKGISFWTGKLSTRIIILSNELPRLADASGALASRFIFLHFQQSFYGREDRTLFQKLSPELPGILAWALYGLRRLNARGHFEQPPSGRELAEQLLDLSSPITQFVREECDVAPGREIVTGVLYEAWRKWCLSNGRDHPGDATKFGRDLRAAFPEIKISNPTTRAGYAKKIRFYLGVGEKTTF